MSEKPTICVAGLGYVGLPLAVEFSKHFPVIGFDVNQQRIRELQTGNDRNNEVSTSDLQKENIMFSSDSQEISGADIIIVAVPTPITSNKQPDLSALRSVSTMVGRHLKQGRIVVYESTVYPGVTEDECVPILEKESGLTCGKDFFVGYSPERINPGDKTHTLTNVTKIVAGIDSTTTEKLAQVYGKLTNVHQVSSIKVAEAAKVIENIQRDLNIALVNELHKIFDLLNIDTHEVLEAAGTKWNFHHYYPGLVGGHCIGVDPYYLTYKAQEVGYHPEIILAGRRVNDTMYRHYVHKIIKKLSELGISPSKAKVLVLGVTFKPNVPDYRNSQVKPLIKELKEYGVDVYAYDPLVSEEIITNKFLATPTTLEPAQDWDLVIIAVKHNQFLNNVQLKNIKNVLLIE